jgi:two-component system nitrogen regulation response regulator GlnG
VVPIRLPPLRERVDDIADLARNFLRLAEQEGLPRKTLSVDGIARLKEYLWPGNVRELENLMRRLAALCPDQQIPAAVIDQELSVRGSNDINNTRDIPAESGRTLGAAVELHLQRYFNMHGESLPPPGLHDRIMREVELPLIALTLSATRGNQLKAAELLGINRNTLRKRIRELDISVTRGKKLM